MRACLLLSALLSLQSFVWAQPLDPQIANLIEEETHVADALDALDRQIADIVLSQNRARLRREEAAGAATGLLARRSEQARRVQAVRDQVRSRLRLRHARDQDADLAVLLSARSIPELVRWRGYLGWLLRQDVALLGDLRAEQRALAALVGQQELAAKALADAEAGLVSMRVALEKQRALHAQLLAAVRGERELLAAATADQAASRRQLTERIDIRSAGPPSTGGIAAEKGRLPRPSPGAVLVAYGEHESIELGTETFSNGWSIGAPLGAPVRSIYDGEVVYAGWYRGFGNLIIIEHGGDYFSLYAHLSAISRGGGDTVKQGDTIGDVGDSGSLRGAQLYFELRHKRRALDPRVWLRGGL